MYEYEYIYKYEYKGIMNVKERKSKKKENGSIDIPRLKT